MVPSRIYRTISIYGSKTDKEDGPFKGAGAPKNTAADFLDTVLIAKEKMITAWDTRIRQQTRPLQGTSSVRSNTS
jgi:hypothetical protein